MDFKPKCLSSQVIEKWLSIANNDGEFVLAAQHLECIFLVEISDQKYLFRFSCGRLSFYREMNVFDSWAFGIRFTESAWIKITRFNPPPGAQSLIALLVTDPEFTCEGNMTSFAQCLHALNRLFEIARIEFSTDDIMEAEPSIDVSRDSSLITGRYCDLLGSEGKPARIFYEEAGKGFPLLLLHTANADGRQYHDLMTDVEIARSWHMFTFDLPYHGRSIPPHRWWDKKYVLTEESYATWCIRFIEKIIQTPCVVMGCSMGGAIAVYLAAKYSSLILGTIALETPDCAPRRRNQHCVHPMVNQASHNPSFAYGLMSPMNPEECRKKAWWYYSQGGYGVYDGDLTFYSDEWNAERIEGEIDTTKMPVYLMTGEYDYSCTPDSTRRLAERIPGSYFLSMKNLGHFPMVENPNSFRMHLIPVLEKIKKLLVEDGKVMSRLNKIKS